MNEKLLEIHGLGDLGLAILLCIVADQHGIITSEQDQLHDVANALEDVCRDTLGLSVVSIDCAHGFSLDDFREGILVAPRDGYDSSPLASPHYDRPLPSFSGFSSRLRAPTLDERKISNVILMRNLDQADYYVQIQALELIRTKRVLSHTAMHATSKVFTLIALNSVDSRYQMNPHLNDLFSICHNHTSPSDGSDADTMSVMRQPSISDAASFSSIIRSRQTSRLGSNDHASGILSHQDIDEMRRLASRVKITAEVSSYIHNVVITMRLHRYVAGGISALATRHLKNTVKTLAVLHGLTYVTPSLVGLAAQKTYPHRLILATPDTERSLRWGSDRAAIAEALEGVTIDSAILAVLEAVETPL